MKKINQNPDSPWYQPFLIILLSAGTLLFLFTGWLSLSWRMSHDTPILFYFSRLIDQYRYIPYRDFFDMNMPGTYMMYGIIGRLFGYTDQGFRWADLSILAITLWMTGLYLKQIDAKAAWGSILLFGFSYLAMGPGNGLQRELFILLFTSIAVALLFTFSRIGVYTRTIGIGLSCSFCFLIKPQTIIVYPWFLFFQLYPGFWNGETRFSAEKPGRRLLLPISLVSIALPVILMAGYLLRAKALDDFLDMAVNYWPLYSHLSIRHQTMQGAERWLYLAQYYFRFGSHALWIIPGILGVYLSLQKDVYSSARRRLIIFLSGMAFLYSLYPVISGQFWIYHWMIFLYFILSLSALLIVLPMPVCGLRKHFIVLLILLVVISIRIRLPQEFYLQIKNQPLSSPKNGRVDIMATVLRDSLSEKDTVQPLDWTGGAVHAMLLSDARPATSFLYDFHFYHHLSDPYIQELRARFLRELVLAQPRYIIQVNALDKPRVSGDDTSREFPVLDEFLGRYYLPLHCEEDFIIYQHIPS